MQMYVRDQCADDQVRHFRVGGNAGLKIVGALGAQAHREDFVLHLAKERDIFGASWLMRQQVKSLIAGCPQVGDHINGQVGQYAHAVEGGAQHQSPLLLSWDGQGHLVHFFRTTLISLIFKYSSKLACASNASSHHHSGGAKRVVFSSGKLR